jgi:hypothetical protein
MGGKAQKSKHGDAAKDHGGSSLIQPILLCGGVVAVIFIGQGEPNVNVEQIPHGWLDDDERDWRRIS